MIRDRIEEGLMDSGLSLGERIMSIYWETEKAEGNEELESPNYYKDKLSEVSSKVKSEIDKGVEVEEAINSHIYALVNAPENIEYRDKHRLIPLTKTLSSGKISCYSSTSLYLILSEMLDFNLFEKYNIGHVLRHGFIRKKKGKNYENLDEGERFNGNQHKFGSDDSPETKPKEFILSGILYNCGCNLNDCKSYDRAIKYFDKALEIDSSRVDVWNNKGCVLGELRDYEEALKCYNKALEIDPDYKVAHYNKKKVLNRLEYDGK
ncbi:MAG: tetratricopeptide repeat protein [Candidatus Aenigmarchaeota archaeon]|nr:tetratricopeptide repeat protein [Candidatus Aenigmarchaeota archaeon]